MRTRNPTLLHLTMSAGERATPPGTHGAGRHPAWGQGATPPEGRASQGRHTSGPVTQSFGDVPSFTGGIGQPDDSGVLPLRLETQSAWLLIFVVFLIWLLPQVLVTFSLILQLLGEMMAVRTKGRGLTGVTSDLKVSSSTPVSQTRPDRAEWALINDSCHVTQPTEGVIK